MATQVPLLRLSCKVLGAIGLWVLAAASASSQSQPHSSADLLAALQNGGEVIVLRHASSPRAEPDSASANPDNTRLERQLDEAGRTTAAAMGRALRELKIPVGTVLSSPTYRALETVRWAQLPDPSVREELGDGGMSMQGVSASQGRWLQEQARQIPRGSNTFIVTHLPNITAAFPEQSMGIADGEALVFGADAKGEVVLRARIKIEDWPTLGK